MLGGRELYKEDVHLNEGDSSRRFRNYINTSGVVHAHSTKCRWLTTTHRRNANEPRPCYHCL